LRFGSLILIASGIINRPALKNEICEKEREKKRGVKENEKVNTD
jgi:hypothetical protein